MTALHPAQQTLDRPTRSPGEVADLVETAINQADERIDAALKLDSPSFDELFGALDDAARHVARTYGETAFLMLVAEDDALREAGGDASNQIEKWRASLELRPAIGAAVTRFVDRGGLDGLDDEAAAYVRRWQADVRLSGATLPAEARDEVGRLTARLAELSSAYHGALVKTEHLDLSAEELAGVPDSVIASYAPGGAPGTFDVPIDDANAGAILERASRRDVRERVDRVYLRRGMPESRAHLEEALGIRRRLADLLGYPSWQALRIENLAAPSTEWIDAFMTDMAARLEPFVAAEMEAMRLTLAAEPGAVDDFVLEDWDWKRADALQRTAIGADPSALDPYLEFETAWNGLAGLSEAVFGVRIVARPERTSWHRDVRAYDLVDASSGELLSHLFVDPFVRRGKAGPALADVLDPGDRHGQSGPPRPPTLALVLNSPLPVDGVSLLSLAQVAMMFHEYGHVLDFGLSTSRFALHRPDLWVPFDWVEGPSGFLERWSGQAEVIASYARHHRTGQPLPVSLLQPLADAEARNTGTRTARHLSMGRLDALLHGAETMSIDEADRRAWAIRRTPYLEGASFPSTLPHLLGGYDAAIYGWVWAQALRDDLLSRFEREGMLSPTVGMEYRRALLERPWTTHPLVGYEQFMGRPWSIEPLLARVARGSA